MALKFDSSVIALTAPPGSGKSLWMIRRIVDDFLHEHKGRIYTNIPFNREQIADYLEKNYGKKARKKADRLEKIPLETIRLLGSGDLDPREWVDAMDLEDGFLILDELHRVCPKNMKTALAADWTDILGYPRHNHWKFIGISQNPKKVHPAVWDNAEARIYLTNLKNQRVKYFGVTFYELWNIKAAFGFPYRQWALADLEVMVKEKWDKQETEVFCLDPKYFPLYDSFAKDHTEDLSDEEKEKLHGDDPDDDEIGHLEEYERYNKFLYLFVVLARRPARIVFTCFGLYIACYMLFFGGIASCAASFKESLTTQLGGNPSSQEEVVEETTEQQPEKTQAQIDAEKKASDLKRLAKWSPETVYQLLEKSRQLAAEVAYKDEIIKEKESDIESLLAELVRFTQLVGMTSTEVIFKDGTRYGLGEKITKGPYKGLSIISIDWRRRGAVLNNGQFLHLDHRVRGCKTCPDKEKPSLDGSLSQVLE